MALEDRSPDNIARVLSHSRLFYGMPPASLTDLISHSTIEDIHPGASEPFRIPVNELRNILEGDLRIIFGVTDERVLGRGNFFGETALLDLALTPELDTVRVLSKTGCTCLVTKPAQLIAWMERHPHLQARLYQHLSQELFNQSASTASGSAA
jgi:CRP-like cAMP-binding protein